MHNSYGFTHGSAEVEAALLFVAANLKAVNKKNW